MAVDVILYTLHKEIVQLCNKEDKGLDIDLFKTLLKAVGHLLTCGDMLAGSCFDVDVFRVKPSLGGCFGSTDEDVLVQVEEESDDYDPHNIQWRRLSKGPPIATGYAAYIHRRYNRRLPPLAMARGMPLGRPQMTPVHKHVVCESWPLMKPSMIVIAATAFHRLFLAIPILRDYFLREIFVHQSGVIDASTKEGLAMHWHAEKVMESLEKVVELMQHAPIKELEEFIHELGDRHAAVNMRVEYMDCVIPFFMSAMRPCLKEKWANTIENSWATFLRRVVHIMKESIAF
jgi:hemoglobin-like flavoprotein